MAVVFRSMAKFDTNAELATPYDFSVAKPTGTIDGDIMLAFIQTQGNANIDSAPSGWTSLHNVVTTTTTNSGCRIACYYRVASSEGSSYTWSLNASAIVAAVILTYQGQHVTTPINVSGTSINDDDQNAALTAPSVVTTATDCMLVSAIGCNAQIQAATAINFTTPTSMTERYDSNLTWDGTTLRTGLAAWELLRTAAGATGAPTSTVSNNGRSCGISVALAPAPGGGGGGVAQTITIGSGQGAVGQVMYGWHDTNTSEAQDVENGLGKEFAVFRQFQDTRLGLPPASGLEMAGGRGKAHGTAVSYVAGTSTNRPKGSVDVTLTIPGARAANDLLLAEIHTDYCNISRTPPAGWKLLRYREEGIGTSAENDTNEKPLTNGGSPDGGTDLCGYIFYKVSDGTETAVTFAATNRDVGNEVICAIMGVFRGVDPAAPIYDYAVNNQTSADKIDAPSINGRNGGMLVCSWLNDDPFTLVVPGDMTTIANHRLPPTGTEDDEFAMAYKALSSDGTTGTKQVSFNMGGQTQSPNDMGWSVTLKPAGQRLVLWSVKADDWGEVGAGGQDAWIASVGYALQNWPASQVIFVFYHEPGGNVNTTTRTAAKYNSAWQRIHDKWKASGYLYRYNNTSGRILLGYTEIKWGNAYPLEDDPLWTHSSGTLPAVIDVLCHDDYNEIHATDGVVSDQLFGHANVGSLAGNVGECWYAMLQICEQVKKPLIIAEFGSVPGSDNAVHNDAGFSTDLKNALTTLGYEANRDGWFDQAANFIKTNALAQKWLKGFCYYHSRGWVFLNADGTGPHPTGEGGGGGQTEILTGGPAGGVEGRLGWIRSFVNDSYFTTIPFNPLSTPTVGGQGGGIASSEAFGSPSLAIGVGAQGAQVPGITSAEAIGVPTLALTPTPRGPTSVTLVDTGVRTVSVADDGVRGIEVL